MRRIVQGATSVLAMLALTTLEARSQIAAQVTNTWPFGAVEDVFKDGNDVFAASGGGILVLNTSASNPELQSGNSQLRSGGLSSQLAVTQNVLYVAAAKQGVTRFARSNHTQLPGITFGDIGDARVINVVSIGSTDVAFIGTNENDEDGKLYLTTVPSSGNGGFSTLAPLDVHARVTALASYRHGSGNNTLTLLVGTTCRVNTQGNPEAVLRFDFDVSGGAPSAIGAPVDTWALPDASEQTGFAKAVVLDIAIDTMAEKAYVAANARGVYRISLAAGGLQDDNSGGWPITKSTSNPETFAAVDVVHLTSPSRSLLIVTRNGVGLDPARQVFGVCGSPLNCDSYLLPDMVDVVGKGVSLYDLGSDPPMRVDALPRLVLGNPVKAKARPPQGSSILIDVADGERGLVVLSAAPSTSDPGQYAVTMAGS